MRNSWYLGIKNSLTTGEFDSSLEFHLDELLEVGQSVLNGNQAGETNIEHLRGLMRLTDVEEKGGGHSFRFKFEQLVNQVLFENAIELNKLFPPNLQPETARKRYQRLIGLFHPDRGVHPSQWLHERFRRVTAEYKLFLADSRSEQAQLELSNKSLQSQAEHETAHSIKPTRFSFTYNPDYWRKRLGSPDKLVRRVLLLVGALVTINIIVAVLSIITDKL